MSNLLYGIPRNSTAIALRHEKDHYFVAKAAFPELEGEEKAVDVYGGWLFGSMEDIVTAMARKNISWQRIANYRCGMSASAKETTFILTSATLISNTSPSQPLVTAAASPRPPWLLEAAYSHGSPCDCFCVSAIDIRGELEFVEESCRRIWCVGSWQALRRPPANDFNILVLTYSLRHRFQKQPRTANPRRCSNRYLRHLHRAQLMRQQNYCCRSCLKRMFRRRQSKGLVCVVVQSQAKSTAASVATRYGLMWMDEFP